MKKQTAVISFLTVICFLFVTWFPCQAAENELYACKNNKTGKPRFVNSADKCKTKTEHLVILNGTDQQAPNNTPPIVGHWTFMQFTVDHPEGPMIDSAPKLSVGDLEIKEDGTFIGWNIVKSANSQDRFEENWSGTWTRLSTYHYKTGDGFYEIVLNKNGDMGMFSSASTIEPIITGHYEYGHMFKDVIINHSELQ